jgi:signal transduction histidine kinase
MTDSEIKRASTQGLDDGIPSAVDEQSELIQVIKESMIAIGVRDDSVIESACKELCDKLCAVRKSSRSVSHMEVAIHVLTVLTRIANETERGKRARVKRTNSAAYQTLAECKSVRIRDNKIVPGDCKDHNESVKSNECMASESIDSQYRNDIYDIFLRFRDPSFLTDERYYTFMSFKRSDVNMPMIIAVSIITVAQSLVFLYSPNYVYTAHPAMITAIIAFCISSLLTTFLIFYRVASLSFEYNISWLQPYHSWAIRLMKSRTYGQLPEDACIVNVAFATGIYLLARVLGGQCPDDPDTMWNTQYCNPNAISHSLPPETLAFTLIILPLSQVILRAASAGALFLNWLITAIFINVSMGLAGYFGGFFSINVFILYQGCIVYEIQRSSMRHFIKSVQVIETMETNSRLQLEVANLKVQENERALEAKRSLVRHIGHEIRTPLNIVCVGTDVLIKELRALNADGRIPEAILEVIQGIEGASSTALEVVSC